MKRHTITHQRASKHFFNICAKCFNISPYIIRLSLSYIFYLINLFFSLRSMLAFTDYSKCIKKAICVISRLKRFYAQKTLCVLCTLGIYIVFDNWLTLHQGWYCDKNTIVLKDKNYAIHVDIVL